MARDGNGGISATARAVIFLAGIVGSAFVAGVSVMGFMSDRFVPRSEAGEFVSEVDYAAHVKWGETKSIEYGTAITVLSADIRSLDATMKKVAEDVAWMRGRAEREARR